MTLPQMLKFNYEENSDDFSPNVKLYYEEICDDSSTNVQHYYEEN